MAQKKGLGSTISLHKVNKKTSIGRGNVKFSSMPKGKKRSFKKYRGQGK